MIQVGLFRRGLYAIFTAVYSDAEPSFESHRKGKESYFRWEEREVDSDRETEVGVGGRTETDRIRRETSRYLGGGPESRVEKRVKRERRKSEPSLQNQKISERDKYV